MSAPGPEPPLAYAAAAASIPTAAATIPIAAATVPTADATIPTIPTAAATIPTVPTAAATIPTAAATIPTGARPSRVLLLSFNQAEMRTCEENKDHAGPDYQTVKGKELRSIGDIWSRARKQLKEGVAIDVKSKVYGNTSRKRVVIDVESIPNIPLAQRTTIRSLTAALDNGEVLWDGKIGIFPFVETVAAKRKSKNREAEVLEMKQLLSVTKEVTKDMLVNQVIPAIYEKRPSFLDRSIVLQQDNARPHISGTNQDFMTAGNANGFNITLSNQPPNSPDLNILDLGFFRAIQSLKEKYAPKNLAELVEAGVHM
ncbi:unnamed protein product [Cuscuta campestris]|uniref:Uncharacterized protein n=1 Tax=Cuscuta campestris TaxID=132261 RepID=A0A484NP12_9ASTE|nr:unnamed protein product [Cuscuta campestris]